ncbi:MAG: hypothetical protein L6N94_03375, partial [Candidatus Methylarchaceae archaeon HK01M]|nr:hypothetical protein [Candidatus Methylarchaceae archaeon HK01M]
VLNFYRDPKTGAKLTGISGRKTGLERIYYKEIDRESIQQEKGFKIFLFHTAIDEFKPLDYMYAESIPLSEVPPSFHYCAGGHIHKRVEQYSDAFGHIVWPGTLFGSTFKDLEDSAKGERRGFYIVEFDDQVSKLNFAEVNVCDIVYEKVSAEGKTPKQVEDELKDFASRVEAQGKVILLKVSGMLSAGKPSDIDFNTVLDAIRRKDPLVIVPNRHGLTAKGLTEIRVTGDTKTEIEMKLFRERVGSYTVNPAISSNAKQILKNTLEGRAGLNTAENLLDTLSSERKENEKVSVFKDRIWHETQTILKLGEIK